MACKVVVNCDSGNASRLDLDKLINMLNCEGSSVEAIDSTTDWSADGFDTVVVCGGDGTLKHAIEKCAGKQIVYAPCGTLNEASHTDDTIATVGKVNDSKFCYVCACGSFTEIGYTAKNKNKQRFKAVAYLPQIVKSYKCHEIRAKLMVDGQNFEGCYTLLMILKSHRCFGFNFNKSYRKKRGLYLLAIKSAGRDCLRNRIKMFFPFFRVFFGGVNAPQIRKNWMLVPFENLTIELERQQDFCLDGEKCVLEGNLTFCEQTLDRQIAIVKTPLLRRAKGTFYHKI